MEEAKKRDHRNVGVQQVRQRAIRLLFLSLLARKPCPLAACLFECTLPGCFACVVELFFIWTWSIRTLHLKTQFVLPCGT